MMTARSHRFSPFVHAVDDLGALCGALPRGGSWTPNTTLPLTCPKCLYLMTQPRYVYCGVPAVVELALTHIRHVGVEGVLKKSAAGDRKTLCGKSVGWDSELVGSRTPPPGAEGLCPVCVATLRKVRTGLDVQA